jgi:hypothetical protein
VAYVIPSASVGGEVGRIRTLVAKYFPVYEARVTPHSLVLAVTIDPKTMETRFDQLRQELWPMNYIPTIRQATGETVVEVLRRPVSTNVRPYANMVLLVLTAFTCFFAGAFLWVSYQGGTGLTTSALYWGGLTFALPLMAILGFHELAHYLVARRHNVEASLPFFVPMPPPFVIFGTFGAFISLREPIPDRRTLIDIGASGPLAGFALAVPITFLGLFLSYHDPVTLSVNNCGPVFLTVPYGDLIIGSSALYYALSLFFPAALIVNLNPLALAGWVGLLVTSINLLPAGQLDGGHVFRALAGPRATWVSWGAVGVLFVLGLYYPGWWIFAFLILILGPRHPPPLNDITPLTWKRQLLGAAAVVILVTGFVVIPISSPSGNFSLANGSLNPLGNDQVQTSADLNFTLVNGDVEPHAFFLSTTVTVLGMNRTALDQFFGNLTWSLTLPNRPAWVESGATVQGNFTLPDGLYLAVNQSGGVLSHTPVVLRMSDPIPADFTLQATVTEDCRVIQALADGAPQTLTYDYPVV